MIKKNEKTFLGINLLDDKAKANYMARIFAPFYEKLLKVWLKAKGFELENRPNVYDESWKHRRTYDYTLKKNGKYYIVEAKCWLAFNNSDYLILKEKSIVDWGEDNFMFFCHLGTKREPYKKYKFSYTDSNDDPPPDGKILIWAKVKKSEVKKIKKRYGFSYIFSVEDAIYDMIKEIKNGGEKGKEYFDLVTKYKGWTEEFFKALL